MSSDSVENPQEPVPINEQPSRFQFIKDLVIQLLLMFMVWQFFLKPKNTGQQASTTPGVSNIFTPGERMTHFVYMSEHARPNSINDVTLVFVYDQLHYNSWTDGPFMNGSFKFTHSFEPSINVKNNGSLYLIACISKPNTTPLFVPGSSLCSYNFCCSTSQLTKYKKIEKAVKKNLLSGQKSNNLSDDIVRSHWHSDISVNTLFDSTRWSAGSVPSPLDSHIHFLPDKSSYFPVIFINNFWNLHEDYKPITEANETLSLNIELSPISLMKFQIYLAQSIGNPYSFLMPEQDDSEKDVLKRTLLETNFYILILTVIVSILHSVFEFLAFKNDISFWRNREDLKGLSISAVIFGVFQSLVVFLYILDNEANFMIIVTCGIGVLIDAWKITRVINVSVDFNDTFGPFPKIRFRNKSTYTESHTQEYDNLALKYLSWVFFPVFIGYCGYSLFHYEHKGWYSFMLSVVYGFLLTFGFIMMTPQLFINYKLKSVAHLPWRMLTYKALNTFIDDVFAFVIRMPMMYRIGCLRDDVVFLIYLYQKWIYPIDKTRVNEFGTSGEQVENKPEALEAKKTN